MWSVTERGREARVIFFGENIHESDEDKDTEKDSNRQREENEKVESSHELNLHEFRIEDIFLLLPHY